MIQVINKLDKSIVIGKTEIKKGESVKIHSSFLIKSDFKDIKPNKYGVIVVENQKKSDNNENQDIENTENTEIVGNVENITDIEELRKIARNKGVSLKGISKNIEAIRTRILENK